MRTDAELLAAWRSGGRDAGRELFDRHVESVSRFLRTKVGDQEREELIQNTFAACLASDVELREASGFRAYVLRAAKNRVIKHYAARQRDRRRFDPGTTSVVDFGPSPSSVLARHQEERVLLHGLRMLPFDLQVVLELHYWEDFTTAQLAEVLEIPQGTVKTRLFRARERLREVLLRSEHDRDLLASTMHGIDDWARALRDSLKP